jgi:hypothetical protein
LDPFREYRVAGSGYAPVGSVQPVSPVDVTGSEQDGRYAGWLRSRGLQRRVAPPAARRPRPRQHAWTATSDPTEASLLALAGSWGVEREALAGTGRG